MSAHDDGLIRLAELAAVVEARASDPWAEIFPGFLALAETVLTAHYPVEPYHVRMQPWCHACAAEWWPCAEARAVLAALGVDPG